MYYVYIIQSKVDGSFYIGRTSDLTLRLVYHNSPILNKGVTHRKIPWRYFYVLEVNNSAVAAQIERHIKKMKSVRYIRNLVKYPELGEKLIKKYS
jgi:putative endonuclease